MTKDEATQILDKWSSQPMIRRLVPQIVVALRLLLGKPPVTVGNSKVKGGELQREPD